MDKNILLHACCGPCSIMPVLRLLDEGYNITLWYMNPNIHPLAEYLRRRDTVAECAERLGVAILFDDSKWNLAEWLDKQLPRRAEPGRCQWCCGSRLEFAAQKAKNAGFNFFSTTLLYSRYQPHDFIAQKGHELNTDSGPQFVYRDFRTDWQAGIDYAKKWDIYRQPYCGCIFSENERYAKKLARLIKSN